MLGELKKYGLFDVVSGVLVGKPMDEIHAADYKKLLVEVIDNPKLPVLFNDAEKQVIKFSAEK